ncbi:MAG: phosphodiester glycosidase family protein [Clostridiales bacterium]|nr:phosphodiester glycosidase family protein [Candidatus Coliplasma caballi]
MKSKLIAFTLAFVMVVSCCSVLSVSAADFSMVEKTEKAYEVTDGVDYSEYTITSGVNGATVVASALQFGIEDYMVLPYAGVSGGAANLRQHYELAKAEGYDVVAVINGDFFSMDSSSSPHGNYGFLNEYLVSNGVIVSAANDDPAADFGGMVSITSDGKMESVPSSKLHFNMYFNGMEVSGGLGYVNKTSGCNNASSWTDRFYYFDCHSGDKYDEDRVSTALTYEICPGYEVLCKKVNNTDLVIGGTLEAEVISVTENTYGGKIGKDEFILFVRTASPFASQATALKAGDTVTISASETVADAASVTEAGTSIMANVGWLVKDGVNLTTDPSFNTNAAHSNTEKARWTAFGTKADGSWMFFTSEGASTGSTGSITLQDVAAAMMKLGCTDVIRMDGGGSSNMYVCDIGTGAPGYKQPADQSTYTRPVADCILLVRRSSETLKTNKAVIDEVKDLIEKAKSSEDADVKAVVAAANSVVSDAKSTNGDYLNVLLRLRYALSGKKELGSLMSRANAVVFTEYSEFVLNNLREAYKCASAAYGGVADAEQVKNAYDELKKWLELKGNVTIEGTEYKTITSGIYLTGMNLSIMTGYSCIFTPGINASGVNLNWSQVILLRWNEEQEAYMVEKNFFGNGNPATIAKNLNFTDNIIPEDCIVIGVHGDTGTPSEANRSLAAKAKKGQILKLNGIDLKSKTTGVGSYFEFVNPAPKYATGDVNGDGSVDAFDYQMLKAGVLNSYQATDAERARMDVNSDKTVDAFDYQMLKAFVLGTYQF